MVAGRTRQTQLLAALVAVMAVIYAYQRYTEAPPETRPLTYTRGMSVSSPVRRGPAQTGPAGDPISVFLERNVDRYPGVKRDLFRLTGDGSVQHPKPKPVTRPVVTVVPPVEERPVKSAEEIAADAARADLASFRFLGYLTDKDSSLFLSKGGELFIAKSGDRLMKDYLIKNAGKDYVVLMDAATKVEVRIELTGSGDGRSR